MTWKHPHWIYNSYNNRTFSTYELFHKILENWVSVKNSDANTIELERILRKGNFNASADEIKALGYKRIRNNLIGNSKSTKIWFEVPQSTKHFIGREFQLQKLKKFYKDQGNNLAVVSGFAGIGKSEVVQKFASIFFKEINGHCIWLQGETEDSFNKSIKRLCKQLKTDYSQIDLIENVQSIFPHLQPDPILVIIDNVDKENNQVLSFIRTCRSLQIPLPFFIVTSRIKTILDSAGNNIEMETLESNEARQLVRDSLQFQTNDDDVSQLCESLHNFPLVLQQAFGYIKNERFVYNPRFNITDYLVLLQTMKAQLFDFRLTVDHTYCSTTIAAWNITLKRIRQRHKLIGESTILLLRILAYSNPDGERMKYLVDFHQGIIKNNYFDNSSFTTEEVESLSCESVDEIEQEIRLLQSYSLCKVNKRANRNEDKYISVHRLVAEVVRLSWSKNEEMNFLDKALSIQSAAFEKEIFYEFHKTWNYALQFDMLFRKHFPKMLIPDVNIFKTYNLDSNEIILKKAADCFGWKNQCVLDFEQHFLLDPFQKADKYCKMFLKTYKRLRIDFGVSHESTQRILAGIDGAHFSTVDFNYFKQAEFSVLVELLIDLIKMEDWSKPDMFEGEIKFLFFSIITAANPVNLLEKIREIVSIIVKNVVENTKKRQTSLWMLKTISIQLKKFKQFEDFKLVQVRISDSLFHPSEKMLVDMANYSLLGSGIIICKNLIRRREGLKLLKCYFKWDINYHCMQNMIRHFIKFEDEESVLVMTKLVLNTLQLLYKKGTCSIYDAFRLTSHLKLVFSQHWNLIEKWETENLELKVNLSIYFNKTIQATNEFWDFEFGENLIDENEQFEETSKIEYNLNYPIDFQNGKFIWVVKERIAGLRGKRAELWKNMDQFRIQNAKSCLHEIIVLVKQNELDRNEAIWSIKEICGFLYFRDEDKFVVDSLLRKVIPIFSGERELKVIKQILNQISFQSLNRMSIKVVDSEVEILFALFKYEFNLPLLQKILDTLVFNKDYDKISKLRERFSQLCILVPRNFCEEEINIAQGVIDNAIADN